MLHPIQDIHDDVRFCINDARAITWEPFERRKDCNLKKRRKKMMCHSPFSFVVYWRRVWSVAVIIFVPFVVTIVRM